jgi:hypothetical protein
VVERFFYDAKSKDGCDCKTAQHSCRPQQISVTVLTPDIMKAVEPIQRVNILQHLLKDDGQFPNNALLPLLVYQQVLPPEEQHAENVKKLFEENDWTDSWEDGVYDYHHYHSTAHEV